MLMPASPPKTSPFLKLLLHRRQNAQRGLTIMECLVAIMLIGITIAMVTPPLLIATASRVQTRRGEQALQAAQAEVDRINTMVQRGLHQDNRLPPNTAQANIRNILPPTRIASFLKTPATSCPGATSPYASYPRYNDQPLAATDALPVDLDGDCDPDLFMQVIRNNTQYTIAEDGKATGLKRPARFQLGVRVYSKLVDTNKTLVSGKLKTEPASLGLTIGQGQQATNPLTVVNKDISWGERSEVLCQYATDAKRKQLSGCS